MAKKTELDKLVQCLNNGVVPSVHYKTEDGTGLLTEYEFVFSYGDSNASSGLMKMDVPFLPVPQKAQDGALN